MTPITIPDAVQQMLKIVERLCFAYPRKRFTLDGRLVGDIGETLVEEMYNVKLFDDEGSITTGVLRWETPPSQGNDEGPADVPSRPHSQLLLGN